MKKKQYSKDWQQKAWQVFLSLLRDALWHSGGPLPAQLSSKQLYAVFDVATEQAVAGLVADALIRRKVGLSEENYYEMLGAVSQVQTAGEQVNSELKALVTLLADSGISYRVVKGQTVAGSYPAPLLRQPGDIDFYCDERNFPLALTAVGRAWGVTPERGDSAHHVHFDHGGITMEGHFSLASFHSRKKDQYWQRLLDSDSGTEVMVDGVAVSTLSPTLHVFYIFLHLYQHLLALGIGLRQFCDLAVMLHSQRNAVSHEALLEHLRQLGLLRAYRACGAILTDCLGLPVDELGVTLTATDRRYGRRLLGVVRHRGNMGHYRKQGGFSGWRHQVESALIKLSHFVKFAPLAPAFSCRWLAYEIKRTIIK